jgi:hypothetical protein
MRQRTSGRAAALTVVVVATIWLAPIASGQGNNQGGTQQPRTTVAPLLRFGDLSVVPGGGSTLTRTRDGVYMSLHAADLAPGTVVTAWWVFFNNPKKCNTSPCTPDDLFNNPEAEGSLVNATGRVVGADGTADYGAFIAVGDTTGAFLGSGLTNPLKAEIHLVTRSHGPALLGDAEQLRQQLTTFNGGCPPNTCANLQASIHQP